MHHLPRIHVAGLFDGQLPLLIAHPLKDCVRVPPGGGEYLLLKRPIPADAVEAQKPQQNIFAPPEIPLPELYLWFIGGKSAVRILHGQKVPHCFLQHGIKSLILRNTVNEGGAAHHFPPIFRTPFLLCRVGFQAVLLHKFRPELPVTKLLSGNESKRPPAHAPGRERLLKIRLQARGKEPFCPAVPQIGIFISV